VKAAVITQPGSVEIATVDDPAPGPREVVVEVAATGLCGTDLHILQGEFAPKLPIIPGHEFAGEVVGRGSEVTELALGDQVAVDPSLYCFECHYCRLGHNNLCERWAAIGVTHPGAAAEYAVAPGQVPGVDLGGVSGYDIQKVVEFLDRLVEERNLPDKVVVVHQFASGIVFDKEAIRPTENVQVVLHADGFGSPENKFSKYDQLVAGQPIQYGGFKLFYTQDAPLLTPEQALDQTPAPVVISYQ